MPKRSTYAFNDFNDEGVLKPGPLLLVAIFLSSRFMLYGPLSLLATRQGFSGSRSYDVSFLEVDSPFEMLVSLPAVLLLIVLVFRSESSTFLAKQIWRFGKPLLIVGALGHVFLSMRDLFLVSGFEIELLLGFAVNLGLLVYFALSARVADVFRSFPGVPFVEIDRSEKQPLTELQRLGLFFIPVAVCWFLLASFVISPLLIESNRGWIESTYSHMDAKLVRKSDGNWFMETTLFMPSGKYEPDSYHPNLRLSGTTAIPLGTLRSLSLGLAVLWIAGLSMRTPLGVLLGGSLAICLVALFCVGLRLYQVPLGTLLASGGQLAALNEGYVRFPETPSTTYVRTLHSVFELAALVNALVVPLAIVVGFDLQNAKRLINRLVVRSNPIDPPQVR